MLSGSNSYKVQDRCGVVAAYDKRASLSYLDCAKLDFERFDDFEKAFWQLSIKQWWICYKHRQRFYWHNAQYCGRRRRRRRRINLVDSKPTMRLDWLQKHQDNLRYRQYQFNYLEFIEFNSLVFDQDFWMFRSLKLQPSPSCHPKLHPKVRILVLAPSQTTFGPSR